MKIPSRSLFVIVGLLTFTNSCQAKSKKLEAYAKFQSKEINESSGFVKSRTLANTYWTHNDSGDFARIFAVTRDGQTIQPEWDADSYKGLKIGDAINIDWEELAMDSNGNLYIGAFGNNANTRKDLAVYKIREPNPIEQNSTRTLKTIPFAYPDQTAFPPSKRNFDCEAFFVSNEKLYFLTKHRSDTSTKLYRLDTEDSDSINELTYINDFEIGAQVTGADSSPDGSKIAVLTYKSIWVFHKPESSDNYLNGEAFRLKIKAGQCEAICWDDEETLIVTNEGMELFEIKESELSAYNPDE
ncbi:hypothetical protein MLD52_17110 [Puniceicoccaceae bacterium K14]|nr:hypothetical protein [Puniceicoccaceae bacterium K14]